MVGEVRGGEYEVGLSWAVAVLERHVAGRAESEHARGAGDEWAEGVELVSARKVRTLRSAVSEGHRAHLSPS
jgi:hypothetical protein